MIELKAGGFKLNRVMRRSNPKEPFHQPILLITHCIQPFFSRLEHLSVGTPSIMIIKQGNRAQLVGLRGRESTTACRSPKLLRSQLPVEVGQSMSGWRLKNIRKAAVWAVSTSRAVFESCEPWKSDAACNFCIQAAIGKCRCEQAASFDAVKREY